MKKKGRRAKTNKKSQAKHERQKPPNGWRPIFSGALAELSGHSWLQNFLVGLALLLIWPLIGATIMKSYQAAIIGFGVGATLLVWIGVVILLRQIPGVESKVMESELHGVLIPAEEPNPPHPCDEAMRQMSEGKPLTPNAVAIHFGNSAALLNEIDKFVVIQVGDEELLSVQEGKDGLSVSAKVFSADSRIVAQIVDNEFHVNPNNYFRISRPDRHSLVVYDQQATEVLNVHFLNPHLVTVLGVFRHPRARLITIRENAVKAGGMIISGSCSFDSPMGIQIGSSSN